MNRPEPYCYPPRYKSQKKGPTESPPSPESPPASGSPPQNQDPSPPPDDNWCRCGNCICMPRRIENVCCLSEKFSLSNLQDDFRAGVDCVLSSPIITHQVLSEPSVQLAWYHQRQMHGYTGDELLFCKMKNANYRHHAYRQYISFIHGYLGKKRRRVIPSCLVKFVRTKWHDPDGHYAGFRQSEDEPVDEHELISDRSEGL